MKNPFFGNHIGEWKPKLLLGLMKSSHNFFLSKIENILKKTRTIQRLGK